MHCRVAGWRPTPLWSDSSSGVQNVPTRNQTNEECVVVQRAHLKGWPTRTRSRLKCDKWENVGENILPFTSLTSGERYFPSVLQFLSAALSRVRPPHCCVAICALKWLLLLLLCLGEARSSTALERSTLTPVGESQNAGFTSLLPTDGTKSFKWQWMIVRIPSDLSL